MRTRKPLIASAILFVSLASPTRSEPAVDYRVVLARHSLGPGEQVELRLSPPPPPDARVSWTVSPSTPGNGPPTGIYRAPYVIAAAATISVTVSISGNGVRSSASTTIELRPGSVPGADDCLGPGQSYSTTAAGITPSYAPVDELPEVIHKVQPEYPRSSVARGIESSIAVQALVCRSGRVLDAWVVPVYRGPPGEWQLIEKDPKLIDAAIAAVRQWEFKPGLIAGQPVATLVTVLVEFRL